jgi:phosphopantothenate-cysteine ligase
LETDSDLLLPKARQALERYGHQVVIGNDLHRRKFEVVFVSKKSPPPLSPGEEIQKPTANLSESFVEYWLRIDIPDANPGVHVKEIEEDIVSELVTRHAEWIKNTRY